MKRKFRPFAFWTDMDSDRKTRIIKIAGAILLAFALFTLVSTVSYMFTWKKDQSLFGDPAKMELTTEVHNAAGKVGAMWGHKLVCDWFGVGSLALVLVLFILSFRMLFGRRSFSVLKAVLLTITAALISSFICSFVSKMTSPDLVFGGGLGGECGDFVISWSNNLFGKFLTGFLLLLMLTLWFLGASTKFNEWFTRLGASREDEDESVPEPVAEGGAKGGFTWVKKVKEAGAKIADEVGKEINPEGEDETNPVVEGEPVPAPAPFVGGAAGTATESGEPAAPSAEEGQPEENPGLEVVAGEELSTEEYEKLPHINTRDELKNYKFPSLDLLDDYTKGRHEVSREELERNNNKIRAALKTFRIDVSNVKAVVGPTVTLYKVYPAEGVKISSIKALHEDIAMALHTRGVRITSLEDSVGIEVANDNPSIVPLKAMLNNEAYRESKAELPVAIGYTITQKVKVFDLADAPHLLVAGATKQGKSVGLNVLITSLIYAKHPSELKFVFIDPKMVEFSAYAKLLKHYLAILPDSASEEDEMNNAIAKTPKQADAYLKSLCVEMDERYTLMSKASVNKVTYYNEMYKNRQLHPKNGHHYLPYIVVIVDEYADLTMTGGASGDAKQLARSVSTSIIRLAQKGRAAGIHVVLATQRPSVDVITGLIKANFPTRIAFRVFSMTDSKTILDSPGAEKLIGRGDMIFYPGGDMERIQCALIDSKEINRITEFIGSQQGYMKSYNTPYYLPAPEPESSDEGGGGMIDMKNLDERFEEAARLVVTSQRGSTSDIQRRLGMGYAKAGRVMDQLEAAGIVGPQEGSKPRQVLVSTLDELDSIIEAYKNQQ